MGQPAPAASGKHPSTAGNLWAAGYSFVLVLGILAYFGLLFFLGGILVNGVYALFGLTEEAGLWSVLVILGIAILAILILRIVVHGIYAIAGLVTTVNDAVPEASAGILLNPDDHPRLKELISDLAREVHSPMPDEIRLTYLAECYAVELREFGLTTHRKLILALGMPHLAVFSIDELRVILGHELAHVGRGDTRLVVFISRFLASLKRSIDGMREKKWRWIDPIYLLQQLYYGMMLRLSAPLQRYQELRADEASAAVTGGELAARTLLKDWLLHHQFVTVAASFDPKTTSDNGQADGDIFSYFATRWHDFSAAGQDYLLGRLAMQEDRGFWDPFPTTVERVRVMQGYEAVESATPNTPARELLDNYDELAGELHQAMYADHSGVSLFGLEGDDIV